MVTLLKLISARSFCVRSYVDLQSLDRLPVSLLGESRIESAAGFTNPTPDASNRRNARCSFRKPVAPISSTVGAKKHMHRASQLNRGEAFGGERGELNAVWGVGICVSESNCLNNNSSWLQIWVKTCLWHMLLQWIRNPWIRQPPNTHMSHLTFKSRTLVKVQMLDSC